MEYSYHIVTFAGLADVGLPSAGGSKAGDEVVDVSSITNVGGTSSTSFGKFIPTDGTIAQIVGVDLSSRTYVALLKRLVE